MALWEKMLPTPCLTYNHADAHNEVKVSVTVETDVLIFPDKILHHCNSDDPLQFFRS